MSQNRLHLYLHFHAKSSWAIAYLSHIVTAHILEDSHNAVFCCVPEFEIVILHPPCAQRSHDDHDDTLHQLFIVKARIVLSYVLAYCSLLFPHSLGCRHKHITHTT